MAKRHEIRLCGFGGQGVILAGHIIGQAAAIYQNMHATFIQDYGPEARGGSTRADVVVSNTRVFYPYIETPNILIAMSQPAYDKYHPHNHREALVIIDEELVKPEKMTGKRLLKVPATRLAEELGRTAVANSVMLGFVTAVTGIISPESMKKAIQVSVPVKTIDLNLKAFDRGFTYANENGLAHVKPAN